MNELPFLLRTILNGHEEDVRTVAADERQIVTGSRDKTVRVWVERGETFETEAVLVSFEGRPNSQLIGDDECTWLSIDSVCQVEHSGFVTTVAVCPPGGLSQLPEGGILSGSRDLKTILWNLHTGSPVVQLTGHKYQISCVAVGKHNEVISASHDGTIRVYSGPNFAEVAVLSGHDGPVQAVLVLPNGDLLSGAGDTTIKLWSKGRCIETFQGHSDTVRGLALLNDVGVVSASHDMTLKLWDFSGQVMANFLGHTALVYSAATSAQGLIASGSEDNTARVWRADGTCLATIQHPGCVWDVAFLPNGDLVTGCADYAARIFTADKARSASAEVQQAFQASLAPKQPEAGASADGQLPDGLVLEEPAALLQSGSKDGQIKVIREAGGGMAYSWSSAQQQWEKVGQVVGGPQGGDMEVGSSQVDGVAFDQVISVEVDDRSQPLRLGVNRGDNPYTLADNFILKHDLPPVYREQIVQYIIQNTGISAGHGQPSSNVDPFTGASAYTPGSESSLPQPGRPQSTGEATGGGVDPFTGVGSRRVQANNHVPATTMLIFDALPNPNAIANKIRSLSAALAAPDFASLLLSDAEASPGGLLDRLLSSAAAAPSGSDGPTRDELALLSKLLRWPSHALFPALDIARMVLLHEPSASILAAAAGPLEMSPLGDIGSALATACAEPQLPANQQTALRLLCNAFKSSALRSWLRAQTGAILDGFSPALAGSHKGARGSGAAFLLNLAIMLRDNPLDEGTEAQAVSAVLGLLSAAPADDEETLFRGVVAIGTLLSGSKQDQIRQIASALDGKSVLIKLQASSSTRVRDAVGETIALL